MAKKRVTLSESMLNKVISESVKTMLREFEEGNFPMDGEEESGNPLTNAMVGGMYSQAAAMIPRMNQREIGQSFDEARAEMGDEQYIVCLESMLICGGMGNGDM